MHRKKLNQKTRMKKGAHTFEFVLESWNVQCYVERDSLLKTLESVPKTKVSHYGKIASSTGWELVVVTVISLVANILTIANILHKHLKKTKKDKDMGPIAYVFVGSEKVILNNMSKEEMVELIKSGTSSAHNED